ncbi:hypothetical protein [Streptomyces muensis]|uniref:Secreted protein n=1 Tax=Streptomyces muensis TaxID=1077944 RepID=A0A9X1PX04_STRM4|nr:hypothetical protein [Streptomyces muensis]MCF1593789.1 hypothetical protein [Streptomyces muensis]
MSVFIQQLPALIGVVIGALGSYVVVVRGDQARFRREQAARWEERLTLEDAKPLLADATTGRDPAGEALIMLGSPAVVDKARAWVLTALEMERFVRDSREDPQAWQALLERQRAGRDAYYTAVRDDLGLPPGHSARWPIRPADPVPPQR